MYKKYWLILAGLMLLLIATACQVDKSATKVEATEIPTLIPTEVPPQVPTEIPAEVPTEIPTEPPEGDTAVEGGGEEEVEEAEPEPEKVVEGPLLNAEEMLSRLGNYVLRPGDLPHAYTLSDDGERHLNTRRLINEMGELEAKTYVKNTGRIDGWWSRLKRTNKEDFAPSVFESSIELFDSREGSQAAMSPDNYKLHKDESREHTPVKGGCDLGDHCEFYYSEKEDPVTELVIAQYNVAVRYRNAFAWVMAQGLVVDLDADYVLDAARSVLAKLEGAPTK
jgi:hypothetical protein